MQEVSSTLAISKKPVEKLTFLIKAKIKEVLKKTMSLYFNLSLKNSTQTQIFQNT